jgi:hypothetical protein
MRLILIVISLIFLCQFSLSQEAKFEGKSLQKIDVKQDVKGSIYRDSLGNQVYECKLMVTSEGLLIPEKGSVLDGWLIFPTDVKALTKQDIDDIFLFIKSRDLKNRMH